MFNLRRRGAGMWSLLRHNHGAEINANPPEMTVLHGARAGLHSDNTQLDLTSRGCTRCRWRLNDCHQPVTQALVAPRVVALRRILAVGLPYGFTRLRTP